MAKIYEGDLNGAGLRFGIVVSRFNDFMTSRLLEGALDALRRHGVDDAAISVCRVPGSFEIPLMAKKMAASGGHDAVICLGVIIRGGTRHNEYMAAEVIKGIANAGLELRFPITMGILTTDTLEQAIERAGSKLGNKGFEAACSAIEMARLARAYGEG